MSMIGNFRLVRPEALEELFADPESIEALLFEDPPEDEDGEDPGGSLDIDKSWHGLHFLLTGTAWEGHPPLNFIVAGGRQIGDVDLGYGPARGFSNGELRTLAAALRPIDEASLRTRFDPKAMAELEIYPDVWDRSPEEDDTLGYLMEHWSLLRAFITKGAADGFAMLVFLT
jgi:hypothetical protein